MDDMMTHIIESDFDVKLLTKNKDASLFYGFKGTLVHFITYGNRVISQTHAPRFEFAVGFEYLFEKEEASPAYHAASKSIILTDGEQGGFEINVGNESFQLLPEVHVEFFQVVKADIQRYLNADKAIDRGEFDEPIEKLRRPSGEQIAIKPYNIQILIKLFFEDSLKNEVGCKDSISLMEMYDRLWDKKCHLADNDFVKMAQTIKEFISVADDDEVEQLDILQFNVFNHSSFSLNYSQIFL